MRISILLITIICVLLAAQVCFAQIDFTGHIIKDADPFHGAASVYAADVDGDGDMDVLGAAEEAVSIT